MRFYTAGRSLQATGLVTARLTDNTGRTETVKTMVALTASTGGGCRVLHLDLKELTLTLLGLRAHLDRVILDVTGNAQGGVLGSLFCKLAKAKVASARVADARALTAAVQRQRGHVLRFSAYIHPAVAAGTAAGTVCPVLDLVVGPLDLQLLGPAGGPQPRPPERHRDPRGRHARRPVLPARRQLLDDHHRREHDHDGDHHRVGEGGIAMAARRGSARAGGRSDSGGRSARAGGRSDQPFEQRLQRRAGSSHSPV